MRKLLDSGHGWVKLSGAYLYGGGTAARLCRRQRGGARLSGGGAGALRLGQRLAASRRHQELNPVAMPDDVVLLNLLAQWAPDAKLRHRILVENPEKFYGFDPAQTAQGALTA